MYFSEARPEEIHGVLAAFSELVVRGPLRRLVVSRSNVWHTTLNTWKLPIFANRSGKILVKFQGDNAVVEPSADDGGPRREFFRLLLQEIIKNSAVFAAGVYIHMTLILTPLATDR